jgi:hypothetical protein
MSSFLSQVCHFRTTLVVLLWACALPDPLRAQQAARGEPDLQARMTEFLRALPDDRGTDTTRRFFPTSGQWTYTRTIHLRSGATFVNRWELPATETSALFGFEPEMRVNPVRESFEINYEGQKLGLLLDVIMRTPDQWHLVGRNRLVPPGAPPSCPTYVEWRREGGKWVISAFGDEWFTDSHRVPPWY